MITLRWSFQNVYKAFKLNNVAHVLTYHVWTILEFYISCVFLPIDSGALLWSLKWNVTVGRLRDYFRPLTLLVCCVTPMNSLTFWACPVTYLWSRYKTLCATLMLRSWSQNSLPLRYVTGVPCLLTLSVPLSGCDLTNVMWHSCDGIIWAAHVQLSSLCVTWFSEAYPVLSSVWFNSHFDVSL